MGLTLSSPVADGGLGTGVKAVQAADAAAHVDKGVVRINAPRLAHIFTPDAFGAGFRVHRQLKNGEARHQS